MAKKLIKTLQVSKGNHTGEVKVYKDTEWNEYQARLIIDGVDQGEAATAHDDELDSILGTAARMLKHAEGIATIRADYDIR